MRTLKESNVSFIGRIPENWVVGKVKFYYDLQTGFTPDTKIEKYYSNNGEGFDWVTIADIPKVKIISNQTLSQISKKYIDEKHPIATPKGSLLYSFKLSIGQVAFTNREIYTNEAIASFLPNDKVSLDYLYYSSSLIINNAQENIYGAMLLNQDLIRKAVVPIPPLAEQKQIATYLDARCSKIDGAIAQRKAIIEKLKEYKSAVITKVVTKGLNPDAEMKDSGIDWIGKIPKHWEYKRLKFLLKTNVNDLKIGPFGSALKGKTLPKDKGEYCIYAQANLIENTFEVTKHYVDAETFSELNSYEIYPDDMLFSMMGTIGKCKAMPHGFTKGIMDSHLLKARFSEEQIYAPYFEYFYDKDNSYAAILQLNKMAVGSIMSGLNCNILKNVMITVPPMNEQMAIVAYLDSQCAKIDEAIEKQEQAVAKLEEYRKSVIYYAVTGKIDCRDKESIA